MSFNPLNYNVPESDDGDVDLDQTAYNDLNRNMSKRSMSRMRVTLSVSAIG